MWFITIVVLAIGAYLILKALKAQSTRKSAQEPESSTASGLQGELKRDASAQGMTESSSAVADSVQSNTAQAETDNAHMQTAASVAATPSVTTTADGQDEGREIREMIKILNLAESDSTRLGINAEEFQALRADNSGKTDATAMPSADKQADIADRLRRMLA